VRLAMYRFSPEALASTMTTRPKKAVSVVDGIPEGAKIVRAGFDATSDQFYLVAEHESFPEHTEGATLAERNITADSMVRE
jgi:hypothetical protein